jgi:hypothetical protein
MWNSATPTPGPASNVPETWRTCSRFFTPRRGGRRWERHSREEQRRGRQADAPRTRATGTYIHIFYRAFGTRIVASRLTSLITEPRRRPDSGAPLPAAAEWPNAGVSPEWQNKALDFREDLGCQDRCLAFRDRGPRRCCRTLQQPITQIVQTKGRGGIIHIEMIHDARSFISTAVPSVVCSQAVVGRFRSANGRRDARRGHGELHDAGGLYGEAGGNFGWDRDLHVIERFTLLDANTLLYQFEIDNPTAFVLPWKGEVTMSRSPDRIFEYACHEAEYSLPSMLRANQTVERD